MGEQLIDAKDKRILFELDLNGREFVSKIARQINLSKEVVNYRIKRLQDQGVILGFQAIINPGKIGYRIYRLFVKYQNMTPEKEEELLKYLEKHPQVAWVTICEGFYDLAILYWAKDVYSFREMCDELMMKHGNNFQNTIKSFILYIHHFKHNFIFNSQDYTQAVIDSKYEPAELDEIDFQIMRILAEDCRISTLDIGKKLKISPNTVKYRIRRLCKAKVIPAFKTMIDAGKLGYQHYKVFLILYHLTNKVRSNILAYLKQNPYVIYVTDAIGPADLEFEIYAKDIKELYKVLRDLKTQYPNIIKETNTCLIYKEHRIHYLPSIEEKK